MRITRMAIKNTTGDGSALVPARRALGPSTTGLIRPTARVFVGA